MSTDGRWDIPEGLAPEIRDWGRSKTRNHYRQSANKALAHARQPGLEPTDRHR